MLYRLRNIENQIFFFINVKLKNRILDLIMTNITHLGGALFTICTTLALSLFASAPWKHAAFMSLVSLSLSHIPVAVIKKTYKRLRPYLVLKQANTYKNPLQDHSFPSGHTTAIFSIIIPFVVTIPVLGMILLPIGLTVALSRIYLGLHYPSDVFAGLIIGTLTAFSVTNLLA
ncbi:phosphatase PAP2 family protein [Chengkuizengella axinellae]|uniref:Phosphatase PAP2 family protein n=1 Tax=Chengkuizengella axinellae TaxID=3064388 RepID=A0ABT9J3P0_9BACL|nr:phosphatase PAP2 family protein [Chengkuizengella sp. 2205SS18-9]MDP5276236.1 phosphatase PAP2 family protein [Chengkuizengella sp. 2205SS18-9]